MLFFFEGRGPCFGMKLKYLQTPMVLSSLALFFGCVHSPRLWPLLQDLVFTSKTCPFWGSAVNGGGAHEDLCSLAYACAVYSLARGPLTQTFGAFYCPSPSPPVSWPANSGRFSSTEL